MIASLPMYWRTENAHLWQEFWAILQERIDLPNLTPPDDIPQPWSDHWLRPDLALSMTCGLPFRTYLKDRVTYVGTLCFGLGRQPGYYFSHLIARLPADHPDYPVMRAHARLAYNSNDSQSGWAVSQQAFEGQAEVSFSESIETGSHAASVAAVATGRADFAFIDAVTWRILKQFDQNTAKIQVVGTSVATPGLPLICAKDRDPIPVRAALQDALLAFSPNDPMAMGGKMTLVELATSDYYQLPNPDLPQ